MPDLTTSQPLDIETFEKKLRGFSDEQLFEFLKVERQEAGLKSLFYHNKYVLGYKDMTERTHRPSCDWLQDWSSGRNKKLFITPRDTFKSSLNTIGHTLWLIAKDPRVKILIVGEEQDNAKAYLHAIQDHLATNETFKETYPYLYTDFDINVWNTETVNLVPKRASRDQLIQKEHTIDIAGVGTTSVGMHYDYVFFVDPHSQKNVNTAEQIEKVIVYYKLLESIIKGKMMDINGDVISQNGRIITEMTRWHFADLANHIVTEEKDLCDTFIKSCYNNDGSLFFPERLSTEVLTQKLTALGTRLFSCLYLSNPQSEQDKIFKPELAQYYHGILPEKEKELYKIIMCDPSISEKENADLFTLVCLGIDKKTVPYTIYILDKASVNRKQPSQAVSDIVIMLNKNFRDMAVDRVGIEEVAFQRIYRFELERALSKRGKAHQILALKPGSRSKKARIMALQPLWEMGHILLRGGTQLRPSPDIDMLMQFEKFPMDTHDDWIDPIAYVLDILDVQRDNPLQQRSTFQRKMDGLRLRQGTQSSLRRRFV